MSFDNLQLALREIRGFVWRPRVIAALFGAAVLATVAQPFGFRVPGPIGLTLIYWLLVIWITFPLGYLVSISAEIYFKAYPRFIGLIISALSMGLLTTALIYGVNMVFLGWSATNVATWTILLSTTFPTAALVTVLIGISMGNGDSPVASDSQAPALLERLKFDLRAPILHLCAEDHYTRVETTKGGELVLIRFRDAISEATPTPGVQTHRSHWVAIDAISDAKRSGDGAALTLKNGAIVPVSRGKIPALKKAGVL